MPRSRNGRRPDPSTVEPDESQVVRDAEESLTSALSDSDTAAEVLHDSAVDAEAPSSRRLLLGTVGMVLTVSGLLALRRMRPRGERSAGDPARAARRWLRR